MGCCFSDESEERSPLLGRQGAGPHTRQPSSISNEQRVAGSARRFKPPPSPAADQGIAIIKIKKIGIPSVDKRLEDHAELYNTQVRRLKDLESSMAELKALFPEENRQENLRDVFTHVRDLLEREEAADRVSVKRRFQHCMEVVYEEDGVPLDVIPAFLAFNQANRLVKEIIDKEGPLLASIQLVVKDEKNLRREVLVASLGADGPDCLKACMDNVTELRRAVNLTEDIRRRASAHFEQLKNAVGPLSAQT